MKPFTLKLILTLSLVSLLSACAGRHVHQSESYEGSPYPSQTSASLKTDKESNNNLKRGHAQPQHHHHHHDNHSHASDFFAYFVFRVVVESIIYRLVNH